MSGSSAASPPGLIPARQQASPLLTNINAHLTAVRYGLILSGPQLRRAAQAVLERRARPGGEGSRPHAVLVTALGSAGALVSEPDDEPGAGIVVLVPRPQWRRYGQVRWVLL